MTILPYSAIGVSIRTRLTAVAEMQTKLAEQNLSDQRLRIDMLACAKESGVDLFVENEYIIEDVLVYGKASRKIVFGGVSGFADYYEVRRKMDELSSAWRDVVTVDVRKPESHRVEVFFTAVL